MTFINKWLRSDIQDIKAYHIPKSENMIKLDAMESPFLVPKDLMKPYLTYLSEAALNRYPMRVLKKYSKPLGRLWIYLMSLVFCLEMVQMN